MEPETAIWANVHYVLGRRDDSQRDPENPIKSNNILRPSKMIASRGVAGGFSRPA